MNELRRLLDRQSEWQKSRATLPWEEKIRLVEAIRESIVQLRSLQKIRRNPSSTGGN